MFVAARKGRDSAGKVALFLDITISQNIFCIQNSISSRQKFPGAQKSTSNQDSHRRSSAFPQARLVLNIIAFVSGCLCIIACCYALLKHRMLVLCFARLRHRASVRTIIQQYQILLSLVVACSCVIGAIQNSAEIRLRRGIFTNSRPSRLVFANFFIPLTF